MCSFKSEGGQGASRASGNTTCPQNFSKYYHLTDKKAPLERGLILQTLKLVDLSIHGNFTDLYISYLFYKVNLNYLRTQDLIYHSSSS